MQSLVCILVLTTCVLFLPPQVQGDDFIASGGVVVKTLRRFEDGLVGENDIAEALDNMTSMPCADSWQSTFPHFPAFGTSAESLLDAYLNGRVNFGYGDVSSPPGYAVAGMTDHNTMMISGAVTGSCLEMAVIWHEAQHYFKGGPINDCDHAELYQSTADLMMYLNANCGCAISAQDIDSMVQVGNGLAQKCNW